MATAEIGVGLIGYGLGGRAFHAPYVRVTPGMHLRAVVSRDPAKVHADKGYDKPHCRRYCWQHHIGCRIARIGVESSERLGRHRWVVERTGAWFNRFRRLRVRDERRADIHLAFVALASALILFRYWQRTF